MHVNCPIHTLCATSLVIALASSPGQSRQTHSLTHSTKLAVWLCIDRKAWKKKKNSGGYLFLSLGASPKMKKLKKKEELKETCSFKKSSSRLYLCLFIATFILHKFFASFSSTGLQTASPNLAWSLHLQRIELANKKKTWKSTANQRTTSYISG